MGQCQRSKGQGFLSLLLEVEGASVYYSRPLSSLCSLTRVRFQPEIQERPSNSSIVGQCQLPNNPTVYLCIPDCSGRACASWNPWQPNRAVLLVFVMLRWRLPFYFKCGFSREENSRVHESCWATC
jgi:hypothetical protein